MNRLRQKAAAIMESQGRHPFFSLATLLHAGSILYSRIVRHRQILFDQGRSPVVKLSCPVISIGNITTGGTGKTPMTLYLTGLLGKLGCRVAVLSRGYRGAFEKSGAVISDGGNILCSARQSGDEPYLMANLLPGTPVLVGRNRYVAGTKAVEKFNPDVIVLDDGFQHQQLARDINILLLDAREPFGNSFLLPRGHLREPVSAALRADAVVFTRYNDVRSAEHTRIEKMLGPRPFFYTVHRPVLRGLLPAGRLPGTFDWSSPSAAGTVSLTGRRVVAFSGLAHNQLFWDTIPRLGGRLAGTFGFEDHHPYRAGDLRRIVDAARTADCLVTTEKDLVRLPAESTLPLDLIVMGVQIDFGDDAHRWHQFIADQLERIQKKFR